MNPERSLVSSSSTLLPTGSLREARAGDAGGESQEYFNWNKTNHSCSSKIYETPLKITEIICYQCLKYTIARASAVKFPMGNISDVKYYMQSNQFLTHSIHTIK